MNRTKEPSLSSDAADVSFPTVGPAISEAIKSTVAASIGSLTDNLTEVIESRLGSFAKRFSEENGATVEQAVKKARRENYTCKRKGNQQQLDHELQVLDKFDEASGALASKSYDKVKAALKEGTVIVSKRVKAIKLADKSEFGWQTVNEYLSDELASDSDDEKRMFRAERRAEKKVKDKRRRQHRPFTRRSSQPTFSNVSSYSQRSSSGDHVALKAGNPPPRLGPCFKISV